MAVAATLRAILGLDASEFVDGLNYSGRAASGFGRKLDSIAQGIGQGFGQRIADAIQRVSGALFQAANSADQMGKLAQKVGIAVDALSRLDYAAKLSDVSQRQLQVGLTKLNRTITEAAGGSSKAITLFNRLGVGIKDSAGNIRPLESILGDLSDKFASFKDGPAKAAAAVALFGKSGVDLLPFLNAGSEGIRELGEEADRLGVTISGQTAEAADVFGDKLDRLKAAGEGFLNKVLVKLLPFLNDTADKLIDLANSSSAANTGVDTLTAGVKGLINGLGIALGFVQLLIEGFKVLVAVIPGVFDAIGESVSGGLQGAQNVLRAMVDSSYTFGDAWEDNARVIAEGSEKASQAFLRAKDAGLDASDGFNKAWDNLSAKFTDLIDNTSNAALGQMTFSREVTKTNAPVVSLGDSVEETSKKLDTLIERFTTMRGVSAPTQRDFAQLGAALQKAFDAGDLSRARRLVAIIEDLADQANKLAEARDLEKFRKSVDDLIDSVSEVDPATAKLLELEMAIDQAVARGDIEAVDALGAAYEKFAAKIEKAKLQAEGFRDFDEINKEAAREFRSIWEDAINDVIDMFARFLSSGGKGGLKGLTKDLADSFRNMFGRQLSNAARAGFEAYRSTGSAQAGRDAFRNAGGMSAAAGAGLVAVGDYASGFVGSTNRAVSTAGGAASGAAYGAAIGTYVLPVIGTAIGAVIGAIVGAIYGFIKSKKPSLEVSSDPSNITRSKVEGVAVSQLGTIYVGKEDAKIGMDSQEFADKIKDFDNVLAQALSPEQLTVARERLANFNVDQRNNAINPEQILKLRFDAVLGTLDDRIQNYARAGATLEESVNKMIEGVNTLNRVKDGLFGGQLGSPIQVGLNALNKAQTEAGAALEKLGLSASTSREDLEKAFEGGRGLTIEQIKLYIAAADALNGLNEAQQAYNQAVEAQRAAVQSYNDFIGGFREEALGLSDFEQSLRALARAERDAVAQANALARAAGLQGAREEDLAYIHQAAAMRAAAAARQIEDATRELADQLYGPLDTVSASASSAASSLSSAAEAIDRAREGLTQFADDLLLGPDSPLQGADKLAKALDLLGTASAAGDAQRVQELASATLSIGRDLFASGRDFNELFDRVQNIIRTTVPRIADAVDTTSAFDSASSQQLTVADRFGAAQTIAQNIADLAKFSGEDFATVAARISPNLTLERLAADLQLPFDRITEFLKSLQAPAAADAQILDPGFGQVTDAIETSSEEVVAAVDDTTDAVEETVDVLNEGNETRRQMLDEFRAFKGIMQQFIDNSRTVRPGTL